MARCDSDNPGRPLADPVDQDGSGAPVYAVAQVDGGCRPTSAANMSAKGEALPGRWSDTVVYFHVVLAIRSCTTRFVSTGVQPVPD